MDELDITYWDDKDGGVEATIVNVEGAIWAADEVTLFSSIYAICTVIEQEQQAANMQGTPRMANIGMQGKWIDGVYAVRFLGLSGFGVSFASKEALQKWINHLANTVAPPKIKTHD